MTFGDLTTCQYCVYTRDVTSPVARVMMGDLPLLMCVPVHYVMCPNLPDTGQLRRWDSMHFADMPTYRCWNRAVLQASVYGYAGTLCANSRGTSGQA